MKKQRRGLNRYKMLQDGKKRKNVSIHMHDTLNKTKKFRSFKSKENIHKKEVGPYHGFGY